MKPRRCLALLAPTPLLIAALGCGDPAETPGASTDFIRYLAEECLTRTGGSPFNTPSICEDGVGPTPCGPTHGGLSLWWHVEECARSACTPDALRAFAWTNGEAVQVSDAELDNASEACVLEELIDYRVVEAYPTSWDSLGASTWGSRCGLARQVCTEVFDAAASTE